MKALLLLVLFLASGRARAAEIPRFQGTITAVFTQGSDPLPLLFTIGAKALRLEVTGSDRPHPINLLDQESGALKLVFPHNRSFVRLPPPGTRPRSSPPGFPAISALPPGIGPQTLQGPLPQAPDSLALKAVASGLGNLPDMPALPPLPPGVGPNATHSFGTATAPAMAMAPPSAPLELQATGEKKELLGLTCQKYELKQRGETLEIWATDQLLPFQPYVRNQPHGFGPQRIEEQWGELLKVKKLFPLLATLKFESGPERFRFEVKEVRAMEGQSDTHFQPPADYHESPPLPF